MCGDFIKFFGNIHNNWVNKIMTNFGLSDGYVLHNGLDQGEILKSFKQMQAKSKIVSVIGFSNASGIFGHLFVHRALDLQVLGWAPLHSLSYSVKLRVCSLNNFLAGHLHEVWTKELNVYTDSLLSDLGTDKVACGTAAFFSKVGMGVSVRVQDLLLSILAELQTIVLALKCIPSSCSVVLHLNNQVALDVCVLESKLCQSDFCNHCWMERCHIFNLIRSKDISVRWVKVKKHSNIMGNDHTDAFARATAHFNLAFPVSISDRFFMADGFAISGNARHFVSDIYYAVN
ncbi:hypothetical protein G9A89_011978 [Geosiphon pyriformis]|nr:hypothetical protein G9A89_011978 [Geosiphon pyriformis]